MNETTLNTLSGHQRERLAHIELVARFWGTISRSDLIERFNTSEAVATRDFSKYRELAPNNLIYDPSEKKYLWHEKQADPLFSFSPYKVMSTLSEGFGDALQDSHRRPFAVSLHLKEPDIGIVSIITRAINRQLAVEVEYHSKSSPNGAQREIVPHAIVDTGLRWHIRAWDRKETEFRDFVINRISNASILPSKPDESELPMFDFNWVEEVVMRLVPHPNKEEIHALLAKEYSMKNNVLEVKCKKALAAYLLDSWNVDASKKAILHGHHIYLHLSNHDEVASQVKNMFLAPGFMSDTV